MKHKTNREQIMQDLRLFVCSECKTSLPRGQGITSETDEKKKEVKP